MLLTVIALLSLTDPAVFQFVVKRGIQLEGWRSGVNIRIGSVESTVFEPLLLANSQLSYSSPSGAITRMQIFQAEARFDWKALLVGNHKHWFQQFSVRGVTAKLIPPKGDMPAEKPEARISFMPKMRGKSWLPRPSRLEGHGIDVVLESEGGFVRIENGYFSASDLEIGEIRIGHLTVKQPWLERAFRDVQGRTARPDGKFLIANLVLEPGIEIRSFSPELSGLTNGWLKGEVEVAAFGGVINAATNGSAEQSPLSFDGNFRDIDIAKLATFFQLTDAAGGTIKQGNFSFLGSLQHSEKATASLWLDATNFQWESRQWDSLALGAALMNGRIKVSKLKLLQGRNHLDLNGEMALPMPGVKWWQNEFSCNITANIEDFTELSALLLPEFKFAAGKAKLDGSIRGHNQKFNGQLLLSGSQLKWRSAPIENLHAAIRLEGNECQITNLEVFNQGDYVRGRGVVNILGATQYWGEFRASIDDLATYAAILQKPVVPEPLAGRALIEWSGEGSAKGQSGKFVARLNKVRSLGALATQLHPINIDLDGSYATGNIQFSKFAISDDQSSLTANVGVGNKALSLQKIRLTHGTQLVLEGDALLPLDVWHAWPNTSLATLLNEETVSQVNLAATGLDLRRASQLAGWNFPIGGLLNGSINATGAIGALKTNGTLTLTKGELPLGWSGQLLHGVEAVVQLQGTTLNLEKFEANHSIGDLRVSGTMEWVDSKAPQLHLRSESRNAKLPLFGRPDCALTSALTLGIDGPIATATVRGQARIISMDLGAQPEIGWLWQTDPLSLPPLLANPGAPWSGWQLDIKGDTDTAVVLTKNRGATDIHVHLSGTLDAPILIGSVKITGANARAHQQLLTVENATIAFLPGSSLNPSIDLKATGLLLGRPFQADCFGPLNHLVRWFNPEPPLNIELVWNAMTLNLPLAGSSLDAVPPLSIRLPAALWPVAEAQASPVNPVSPAAGGVVSQKSSQPTTLLQ